MRGAGDVLAWRRKGSEEEGGRVLAWRRKGGEGAAVSWERAGGQGRRTGGEERRKRKERSEKP